MFSLEALLQKDQGKGFWARVPGTSSHDCCMAWGKLLTSLDL